MRLGQDGMTGTNELMANEPTPGGPDGTVVVQPATKSSAPAEKKYRATIYPIEPIIAVEFAEAIAELENTLKRKIWLMSHGELDNSEWGYVSRQVFEGFRDRKSELGRNQPVALLLHSRGGTTSEAYKIVRLFQRRTNNFSVIVPIRARSAATLMALAGKEIIMGIDAELGPLDVQLYDQDKNNFESVLGAVQSLERLNAYALLAFDQAMFLLKSRMQKKPETLMPTALSYATSIVKPLVEKIDTIELTRQSRDLKVAEDYAVRLMMTAKYTEQKAKRIASNLVERYSTHDFVVDRFEAGAATATSKMPVNLGINVTSPSDKVESIFTRLAPYLERATIIGRIVEMQP
jgi:membrane-bound ClpP family serine protease